MLRLYAILRSSGAQSMREELGAKHCHPSSRWVVSLSLSLTPGDHLSIAFPPLADPWTCRTENRGYVSVLY